MSASVTHTPCHFGPTTVAESFSVPTGAVLLVTDVPALPDGLGDAAVVRVRQGRPRPFDLSSAAEALARAKPGDGARVVAIGSGAAIDTAKLAALEAGIDPGKLVLVPCGREPWRAFAPFGVLLEGPGAQRTVPQATFGACEVELVASRLRTMSFATVAVAAVDAFSQAVDSLLSTQAHPSARALAESAAITASRALLRAVHATGGPGSSAADEIGLAAADVIVAGAAATQAFMTTRLGVAHALATHLAALTCAPHDRASAIAGRAVIARWADLAPLRPITATLAPLYDVSSLAEVYGLMLELAGLPLDLRSDGITWPDVQAVLPLAATSSGLKTLPTPFDHDELTEFARSAWSAS